MTIPLRDVRNHIGQLVIAGFDGPTIPNELEWLAREFDLGGVILFDRNVSDPEQVIELTAHASRLARELPLWISVDQEGGRVARLRAPFTEWPAMRLLGEGGDAALAGRFARALASELRIAGFNLDFAPVLDVATNPQNTVIGDRALASDADRVATLGAAIINALQQNGVAACGKHFPGHGDTVADSHHELPVVEHPLAQLKARELIPFRVAVEAQVAAIMTAHVLVPEIDPHQPATLSPRIVTDLLKTELAFDGLVVSDDLEMRAVSDRYPIGEAAVLAVTAGCDVLLMCAPNPTAQVAGLEALIHAVEEKRIPIRRIEDALSRQQRVKERFLTGGVRPRQKGALRSVIGCDDHRAIADLIARRV